MVYNTSMRRGFINAIILVIITLIILGYFKIDIKSIISTQAVQNNLTYVWELVVKALYAVRDFITGFINFSSILEKLPH